MSKAYRLYNSEKLCVEESMHVKFHDKEPGDETPQQIDIAEAVTASETPEAEAAPDVPTAEAFEEDQRTYTHIQGQYSAQNVENKHQQLREFFQLFLSQNS